MVYLRSKKCLQEKKKLYTKFLQYNNQKSLQKYKSYKNKLTKILRSCEKMYYDKILEQQKKDIKGTWNILNKIIGKKKSNHSYPDIFTHNNKKYTSKRDISNGFNHFFVNVGSDLAKNITSPNNVSIEDYLQEKEVNSIFLKPTCEDEVLKIVKQAENKNSTDSDGLSMNILKQVFHYVSQPFTDICNKSLLCGFFRIK